MPDLENIAEQALEREEAKDNETTEQVDEAPKEEQKEDTVEEADEKDEGYSADELEEDEGEKQPSEAKPIDTDSLPTREAWIYDSLPSINVRSADGKEYNVKLAQELPDDFEFANKRDEAIFNQSLAAQENKATQLYDQWNKKENDTKTQEFIKQERLEIQADIAELQKSGDIPKFKLKPTDEGFSDDPGVKQTQEYIDFYEKHNRAYAEAGKAYRISFKDAVNIYKATHPAKEEAKPDTKLKGDDERRKTSAQVSSHQQGDSTKSEGRRKFAPGTDLSSILDYHMQRMD